MVTGRSETTKPREKVDPRPLQYKMLKLRNNTVVTQTVGLHDRQHQVEVLNGRLHTIRLVHFRSRSTGRSERTDFYLRPLLQLSPQPLLRPSNLSMPKALRNRQKNKLSRFNKYRFLKSHSVLMRWPKSTH